MHTCCVLGCYILATMGLPLRHVDLTHLVVANILPPMFSLTQSFLEGASGVEINDVALSPKSPGSMLLLAITIEEGCGGVVLVEV